MNLLDRIRLAIFGPDTSLEEAEASYQQAKDRYDACVSRKDKRGQGEALRALNAALNDMLRVHYARPYGSRSIPTAPVAGGCSRSEAVGCQ